MSDLKIAHVDPAGDPSWDEYASSHEASTVYHLAAWSQILAHSYRYRSSSLKLLDAAGETRGVLPLMYRWGPVSKSRLRSLPVVPTAGPLADDLEGAALLTRSARDLARERDALMVVGSRVGGLESLVPDLTTFDRPPSWILELSGEEPAPWLENRSTNLARSIRKAERSPLRVRVSSDETDLRTFYRLYLATMRGHRSLPRLFRQMLLAHRLFRKSGIVRLFVVEHGSRQVSGGFFHVHGGTIELLYNASDPAALGMRPNHALFRFVIDWALERGLERLDFGFAWPETSLASFKRQWGARAQPEHGYAYDPNRSQSPAGDVEDAVYPGPDLGIATGLLGRLWSRSPLALTRLAGGIAYRYL